MDVDAVKDRPQAIANAADWPTRAARIEAALATGNLKLVFIVGMARSGTTWLSQLLAQESIVSVMRETHLFDTYLKSVRQTMAAFEPNGVDDRLSCEPETLRRALRDLVLRVLLERVPLETWPRIVVEKTPTHCFFLPLIRHLLPEAYILDIVRDPRGVIASWQARAKDPIARWARRGTIDLGREWVKSVRLAEEGAATTKRYRRVRYDALHERGSGTLAEVFSWLGHEVDEDTCRAHLAACGIDRLRAGAIKGPLGPYLTPEQRAQHFRRGETDGWRKDLSRSDIARIERVAGATMAKFGYACDRSRAPVGWSFALAWLADALERIGPKAVAWLRR